MAPRNSAKVIRGKPATATAKVNRCFTESTPVVQRCSNPRSISRLVIVPKLAPGLAKDDPDHGLRMCVNALINKYIKPDANTIPLAVNEIIKLAHCKHFLQLDGANAYRSIPLCEESMRLTAFHTPDGLYCLNRFLMGAKLSSAVQQSAYRVFPDPCCLDRLPLRTPVAKLSRDPESFSSLPSSERVMSDSSSSSFSSSSFFLFLLSDPLSLCSAEEDNLEKVEREGCPMPSLLRLIPMWNSHHHLKILNMRRKERARIPRSPLGPVLLKVWALFSSSSFCSCLFSRWHLVLAD